MFDIHGYVSHSRSIYVIESSHKRSIKFFASFKQLTDMSTYYIYVMHQQDRLLLSQLCPTFPPVWME